MATSTFGDVDSLQFWPIAQERKWRAQALLVSDRGSMLPGCLTNLTPTGFQNLPGSLFFTRSPRGMRCPKEVSVVTMDQSAAGQKSSTFPGRQRVCAQPPPQAMGE
jgi:hypothetical protein